MSLLGSLASILPLTGRDIGVAEAGAFYTALTPTPGTGIIGHPAPTTFDETKAYFQLYNGGNVNIYPVYVRFYTTVASVGGTGSHWIFTLDTGNRYSSGGTALVTQNTNMNSANRSGASINVGAVVTTAASAVRRVINNVISRPAVIDQVGDLIQFSWGSTDQTDAGMITGGTAQCTSIFNLSPVIIGPGQSFGMYEWKASQSTGPTLEVEFGYFEK